MATETVELTEHEQELRDLKAKRDEHEVAGQVLVDALDETVRRMMDEEGASPSRLAEILGVTRGRIYQFRDRGREKHQAKSSRRPRRKSK